MQETTLNLTKGENIDLTKTNPNLKVAHVGLGWDISGNPSSYDLDAFALLLAGGKLVNGKDGIVYFHNKTAPGVQHMGDNLTGVGDGDDETIKVTLASLPATADEILIAVNIYQATEKRQNFGQVNNAFIRIYDGETSQELAKFDLTENYSGFTGMVLGKLYKKDNEWKFKAVGDGKNGTIADIAQPYMN